MRRPTRAASWMTQVILLALLLVVAMSLGVAADDDDGDGDDGSSDRESKADRKAAKSSGEASASDARSEARSADKAAKSEAKAAARVASPQAASTPPSPGSSGHASDAALSTSTDAPAGAAPSTSAETHETVAPSASPTPTQSAPVATAPKTEPTETTSTHAPASASPPAAPSISIGAGADPPASIREVAADTTATNVQPVTRPDDTKAAEIPEIQEIQTPPEASAAPLAVSAIPPAPAATVPEAASDPVAPEPHMVEPPTLSLATTLEPDAPINLAAALHGGGSSGPHLLHGDDAAGLQSAPQGRDSDGDGISDEQERSMGTDPTDADSPGYSPFNVVAVLLEDGTILLQWEANHHERVDHYAVFRTSTQSLLGLVPAGASGAYGFHDQEVPPGAHQYVVAAVLRGSPVSVPSWDATDASTSNLVDTHVAPGGWFLYSLLAAALTMACLALPWLLRRRAQQTAREAIAEAAKEKRVTTAARMTVIGIPLPGPPPASSGQQRIR